MCIRDRHTPFVENGFFYQGANPDHIPDIPNTDKKPSDASNEDTDILQPDIEKPEPDKADP